MNSQPSSQRSLGTRRRLSPRWKFFEPAIPLDRTVPSAAVAGVIATSAMFVCLVAGYALAASIGSANPSDPLLSRWMWALANNSLTRDTQAALPLAAAVNFLIGICWALVYAVIFAPRLTGPGWRKGMVFSLVPWALSIFVFFPFVGAGILGLRLGAGPLPILGNLVLHLTYGAVLGQMYGPWGDRFLTESGVENPDDIRLRASEERAMALGILLGLVPGGVAGLLASLLNVVTLTPTAGVVVGAVCGSLIGAFTASFMGSPRATP